MRSVGNDVLPTLVHSYPDNSTRSPLWKKSCRYHCMQTEPGLDKFLGNASGVRASLEPLILLAEEWVPLERRPHSPIFVLATAGLRKLAVENARWIFDEVEAVLREHTFRYSRGWIRVLTGKEEGYYGWVALNYEMRNRYSSLGVPTLGLLDLGGSSLQVVVEVEDAKDDTHLIRSKIGSIEHNILAYSLPAFGLNEAFDRTVAMLSQMQPLNQNAGERIEIQHPCLSSDFVQNYTCYGCNRVSIADQKNLRCQIEKTQFISISLVGEPHWKQCKEIARAAAMNFTGSNWQAEAGRNCSASLSSYGGSTSNIPNLPAITRPTEHFHALSGFSALNNMLDLSSRANLTKIWEKGHDLCLKSWSDGYKSKNHYYADRYCFQIPYMASLIEDYLCLSDRKIIFGPGNLSWTSGAALVEGEYLWHGSNNDHTSIKTLPNMEIMSSPIFIFVLLLCLLLIVYFSQIKLPMPGKKGPAIGASLPSYVHPKLRPN